MDPSNPYGEIPMSGNGNSHSGRKKAALITAITFILIAASVLIALIFTEAQKREAEQQALNEATRVSRDGYGALDESIGDPAALAAKESLSAINYDGAPVVDACHLLPLSVIREQSLYVTASTEPGAISRHFIDGGNGEIDEYLQESKTAVRDANSCNFTLNGDSGDNRDSLRVEVFQPGYANDEAVRRVLDDYLIQGELRDGVQIYDRVRTPIEDSRLFHFLQKDDVYVGVEFNIGDDRQGVIDMLLDTVAERLAASRTLPHGPINFRAESPTFTARYGEACSISTANDVTTLFDKPANPSVQERLSTATAIVNTNGEMSNSIRNQCIRRVSGEAASAPYLTVDVASFESDAAAEMLFSSMRPNGAIELINKIGNQSFYQNNGSTENKIVFQSGTIVVTLSIYAPSLVTNAKEDTIAKMSLVAEALFARLKGNPVPMLPTEAPDAEEKPEAEPKQPSVNLN